MDHRRWPLAAMALALALGLGCLAPPALGQPPQDVILVLDNSGSMQKNDPEFLTALAVRGFLQHLQGDARIAVLTFDQDVRWAMPLTPLTQDSRARFVQSLDTLDYKGLFTDSPAAMERAIYELRLNGRPEAEHSIIFLTDGIVDTGDKLRDRDKARWLQEDLSAEAADAGIRIFGIAFTESADFQLIQAVSRRTGGSYFRAFSAEEVDGVFERIVATLERAAEPAPRAPPPEPPPPAVPEPVLTEPVVAPAPPTEPRPQATETEPPATEGPAPPALPTLEAGAPPGPASSAAGEGELPTLEDAPGSRGPESAAEASAAESRLVRGTVAPEPRDTGGFLDGVSTQLLAVGGAAALVVVLALVALIRRRTGGTTSASRDPVIPQAYLTDLGAVTEAAGYELGEALTVVGRIAGPDGDGASYVVIRESTIGRRHALIEYKDHAFWVIDQGSLNGTFVNNVRVEGETRLKHGDRLRFHKHEFEFLVLDMFDTDLTMLSQTVFAGAAGAAPPPDDEGEEEEDDSTEMRPRAG